ncbi:MAG: type II secretion system protein [Candidatus Dojkabacteria bacterium]|nr:type II secretion system protein [Candidatus Dojkabacteria bacterium]
MNRKYSGFTLVEMLIVMGIIIILMAVGIAAGRFAINRANDVAHQNAADQLFIASQSFLTDEREYPMVTDWKEALDACSDGGPCLTEYLSIGEFRGGTDATFYYWTSGAHDSALVCVSLGGPNDEDGRGFYCTGNGFSSDTAGPGSLEAKEVENDPAAPDDNPGGVGGWVLVQEWVNDTDSFGDAVYDGTNE